MAVSNTSKEATMKTGGEVEAEEEETTTAVVRLNVKVSGKMCCRDGGAMQ